MPLVNTPPVTFDRPLWLLALPVAIAYFVLVTRCSQASLPRRAQTLALGVRLAAAVCLVLALAGLHGERRTNKLATLFVLDISQSVSPEARALSLRYIADAVRGMRPGDQSGVITFGKTPVLDVPLSSNPDLDQIHGNQSGDATDLAAALRLAEGTFPETLGRKIVVLSDGNETRGSAMAEADTLHLDAVRLEVAPTDWQSTPNHQPPPEALITSVQTPGNASLSAPFSVRVEMQSTVAQTGQLVVTRDSVPFAKQQVKLATGANEVSLSDRLAQPGLHRYAAHLVAPQDTVTQNNTAFADIAVRGRPRVLYLTDAPRTAALPAILRAQGMDVDVQAPAQTPSDANSLTAYDGIVLSGVPAQEFSPAQQSALHLSAETFGVGLGMIGGPQSFGAGGWEGTPVEVSLPVTMAVPQTRKLPSAAVVVVLDASGSMGQTEDGVEKVQLGARAAVQLMSSLLPTDQIAVTSVTTETSVVVPLQPAADVAKARTAIEDVHAGGGGIYCEQGLEDAYALLLSSHAAIKHVILVADTSDSEQQDNCLAMAADAQKRYHITTTVCGIGRSTDSDVSFQRGLAKSGGGQWAAVGEAADLPALFRRDVQTLKLSWFVETPARAVPMGADPLLAGIIFSNAPLLLGHNIATPRPGAFVPLTIGQGDPLLAYQQRGLGRTFAFLGDDQPHWASQWLGWGQSARFYTQMVRGVLRTSSPAGFAAAVDGSGGKAHLTVDTDLASAAGPVRATVVAPDLSVSQITLSAGTEGRKSGVFDADQVGTYVVSVRQDGAHGGQKTLRFAVPYAPEYASLGPNLPLLLSLADATGGSLLPDPKRVFAERVSAVLGDLPLAPGLLLLAALLFVGDIAVRRLALSLPAVKQFASVSLPKMAHLTASKARSALVASPKPVPPSQVKDLLSRPLENRAPSEMPVSRVNPLSRTVRSDDDDDDPFPQVASLRRRPER